MNRLSTKTAQLVGMGILTALVIVLQTFASGFKIGTFSPPLSLIPIIMGAVLFGELAGAILGLVFGVVVLFAVISGAEPFSTLMLQYNPAFQRLISRIWFRNCIQTAKGCKQHICYDSCLCGCTCCKYRYILCGNAYRVLPSSCTDCKYGRG